MLRFGLVDAVDARVERRRLAAAGRAGDEDDAVGPADEPVHQRVLARAEAEVRQVEQDARLVEQAHDDALVAAARRDGADADVEALAGDLLGDAPVLRQALLGDVERALDLDAADDAVHEGARRAARDVELAVDAVADDDLLLLRLDVDVARALLHRLQEERVDPADDGRLVVGVEDVARRLLVGVRVVALELLLAGLLLVDAVDCVLDAVAPADDRLDRLAEDDAQVVERLRVERVAADHVHRVLVLAHHEDPVRLRERDGHAGRERRGDRPPGRCARRTGAAPPRRGTRATAISSATFVLTRRSSRSAPRSRCTAQSASSLSAVTTPRRDEELTEEALLAAIATSRSSRRCAAVRRDVERRAARPEAAPAGARGWLRRRQARRGLRPGAARASPPTGTAARAAGRARASSSRAGASSSSRRRCSSTSRVRLADVLEQAVGARVVLRRLVLRARR